MYLETLFLDVTTEGEENAMASDGSRPGLLLNMLQCTEKPTPPPKELSCPDVHSIKAEKLWATSNRNPDSNSQIINTFLISRKQKFTGEVDPGFCQSVTLCYLGPG